MRYQDAIWYQNSDGRCADLNDSFQEYDFEHPSILLVLEDKLKGLLGGSLLYNPYFKTFGLKGNERVLDFGCGRGRHSIAGCLISPTAKISLPHCGQNVGCNATVSPLEV